MPLDNSHSAIQGCRSSSQTRRFLHLNQTISHCVLTPQTPPHNVTISTSRGAYNRHPFRPNRRLRRPASLLVTCRNGQAVRPPLTRSTYHPQENLSRHHSADTPLDLRLLYPRFQLGHVRSCYGVSATMEECRFPIVVWIACGYCRYDYYVEARGEECGMDAWDWDKYIWGLWGLFEFCLRESGTGWSGA